MKYSGGDVYSLPSTNLGSLFTQTDLTFSLQDQVNLLLFLIMPGDLTSAWFESNMAKTKGIRLNG
jgi:hypothetical protein